MITRSGASNGEKRHNALLLSSKEHEPAADTQASSGTRKKKEGKSETAMPRLSCPPGLGGGGGGLAGQLVL